MTDKHKKNKQTRKQSCSDKGCALKCGGKAWIKTKTSTMADNLDLGWFPGIPECFSQISQAAYHTY